MRIKGSYRKALSELADRRFPGRRKELLAATQANYDRLMAETPDIGGSANMQFEDLNFIVVFFAFHEATGRALTPEDLDWFADQTMVEPARRSARLIDWNSPLMPRLAARMYGSYKRTIDEHLAQGEWQTTWRFEINPEGHTQGFSLRTRGCPNWDFVRAHGYEEFMPVICAQDLRIAEAMHGRLVRYHTVAHGDGFCDWWYFGDKTPQTEEEREYISRQEGPAL